MALSASGANSLLGNKTFVPTQQPSLPSHTNVFSTKNVRSVKPIQAIQSADSSKSPIVSDKMNPDELVKLIEILNPQNKPGRITIITRMGAENMRVKLPHLIRAVRRAGQIVTWVSDPMHGNTIKAPCGLKTRPFDSIRVSIYIPISNSSDFE
nr:phospho-2-dehydro-3-deoxyheptonate aldolase 1, chloroplastic-like [Ipomoea batatas]